MINTYLIKQKFSSRKLQILSSLIIITAIFSSLVLGATSSALTLQEQINQLRSQNNNLQTQTQSLRNEAASLEAVISGLQEQIAALEAQIRDNEAKRQVILNDIVATEAEIVKQKALLGESIRAMYLDNDMSTFEMLLSSKDLSEFVDKDQYRSEVKDKIKTALDKINALKLSLDKQKLELEKILADQRNAQAQLDVQRAEQARLLALNQNERASLDNEIRANSAQISSLRSQQAAANARLFGNGVINMADHSGYPWSGVPFPNTMADTWGMYKRQCVSYTAWKVAASGRHMPYWGGHGNANQWDENARRAGIPVDGNPRVGDVAVSNAGYYGHVMYVEAVYGDGTIYVSQYNAGWTGSYSEARVSIGSLVFIHF